MYNFGAIDPGCSSEAVPEFIRQYGLDKGSGVYEVRSQRFEFPNEKSTLVIGGWGGSDLETARLSYEGHTTRPGVVFAILVGPDGTILDVDGCPVKELPTKSKLWIALAVAAVALVGIGTVIYVRKT